MKTFLSHILMAVVTLYTTRCCAQDSVADHMLLYQRSVGGWPKHIGEVKIDYTKALLEAEQAGIIDDRNMNDATIDNNATTKEIRYLIKAYKLSKNKSYLTAAENGIRYLLKMQQPSGGFPQFYPDSSSYRAQITYNDNAMINALNVLWDVAHQSAGFDAVNPALRAPAAFAVQKGIQCILNTQVRVRGKLTVWCAQHDRRTLLPVKARAFELPSLSGSESVGITEFLMRIEHPDKRVQNAVKAAAAWFKSVMITGYRYVDTAFATGKDRVIAPDPGSVIWARFYDLETNQPFFSGRNSEKKQSVSEIELERRIGYAWYGTWPAKFLSTEYPAWKQKNNIN